MLSDAPLPPALLLPLALGPLALGGGAGSDKISQAPPGMVLVGGERVTIGIEVEEAEEMVRQNEAMAGTFASETPQHSVKVDDFYLMVTEVTNEQYAEYVRATGAKPPLTWGEQAISAGREEYLKAQHEAREEARKKNQPLPERELFDMQGWWDRNWEGAEWEVPEELAAHPVYYVDYAGATGYARWAGVRLPTEFEYQAAVRGRTENPFPWGDEWDDKKYAHSIHYGLDETLPVGSFPEGATERGIHDLAGSVWEWTSSPYKAYPRYEDFVVKVGPGRRGREVEASAPFDANQRVAVGGCYKTPKAALRCTTRRGSARSQSADGLGFRCAASVTPGLDMANTVLYEDVPPSLRPVDAEYEPERVLGIDRWQTRPGAAQVEGYSVVTSYDAVLFLPTKEVPATDESKLDQLSDDDGLVHLGLLYTTEELLMPQIPPGTYFVAYRGAARRAEAAAPAQEGEAEPGSGSEAGSEAEAEQEDSGAAAEIDVTAVGADPTVANLLFLTTDGVLVGAVPRRGIEVGRISPGHIEEELVRNEPNARPQDRVTEMDVAILVSPVESIVSKRGFMLEVPVGLAPGSLAEDQGWRRP